MSTKMKNGKLPVGSKPRYITAEEAFGGGVQDLPPDVAADMKAKGYTPRWLNAETVYKNQGYHPKGWKVYIRPKQEGMPSFKMGQDPEGIVRRGTSILGYKDAEEHRLHMAYLAQRRNAELAVNGTNVKKLKDIAKEAGSTIDESEDDES